MAYFKPMFERYLEAVNQTDSVNSAFQYQKQLMKDYIMYERMIDDVADRVIEKLSITGDTEAIIKKIKELDELINNLGR